ncbi:MAG: hypothetical protein HYV42_05780 [Candidatus Magasanikbacteria bacterium]|nr:hypothetical protein [Candidatus Magasanikbacteria bacterium]
MPLAKAGSAPGALSGAMSEVAASSSAGRKTAVVVAVIFALLALGALYRAFDYRRQLADLKANPQKIVQDEVTQVVTAVAKLMVLPEGETPTLATVADPSRLKDQPFFARAKVGDKLLLYTQALKAVLYDPAANKILEVAPLSLGNPAPAPAPAPARQ